MSITQDTQVIPADTSIAASPWWGDPRAARLLHKAASEGAAIINEAMFLDGFPEEPIDDEWFLDVDYGAPGYAFIHVRYTTAEGFWSLEVDTQEGTLKTNQATLDDFQAASLTVMRAATLCRDLNFLVKADQNLNATVADEISALLGDWGMETRELAALLSLTHGALMSKLSGRTAWTAVDMARIHRAFGPETTAKVLGVLDSGK